MLLVLASLVMLLVAGGAACGSDAAEPPSSSSTTTSPGTEPPATAAPTSSTTTTAAPTSDEAEVRAVIDRYWEAYLAATNPPDPQNADLNAILAGDAQLRITGAIEVMKNEDRAVVKPEGSRFESRIISVRFDEQRIATIDECVIDDLQMVRGSTGEAINTELVTSRYITTMRRYEDGWRITTSNSAEESEGVSGCAASW